MNKKQNILIADDHDYFLDGLQIAVEQILKPEKIFRANNGFEIIDIVANNPIDLLIMDIEMPKLDGIKAIMKLHSAGKNIKTAVITSYYDIEHIKPLMRLNIAVILDKQNVKNELEFALDALLNNKKYFTEIIGKTVLDILYGKRKSNIKSAIPELTKREKEIFAYLVKAMSNKEIAEVVSLSPKTIDTHRNNIYFKFEVKNAAQLIVKAMSFGMID
ncbi:MAG: response regulator transcription factor [Bacteroidales bacterium]|nr:response regulator transcription factor [Bacteroidales bacterium]